MLNPSIFTKLSNSVSSSPKFSASSVNSLSFSAVMPSVSASSPKSRFVFSVSISSILSLSQLKPADAVATAATAKPMGPLTPSMAALSATTPFVNAIVTGTPASSTPKNTFRGPGKSATLMVMSVSIPKNARMIGVNSSINSICALSAALLSLSRLPANVSF